MRVPLRWLEEYVDVDVPVERLTDLLDLSGTKVETVTQLRGSVEGVIVSEVVEILEHPNADNLTLVEVEAGAEERPWVVCGAHNFSVGDRVPYAQVGARLGQVGLEITERKIRGVTSKGMLCSAAELGISKDHSGILVLPPDAQPGRDVGPLLGLDDTILELELTPNRPDCMSMVGLAREVAAILGNELKMPEVEPETAAAEPAISVKIEDPDACLRYVARYIEGLSVAPSPSWIAARLIACGIRPISNVVDATNYVMLELGHPMHPFDAAKVHDRGIVVRRARRGERITTLDDKERTLAGEDLVIADRKKALGLAGVMGGLDSEVSAETTAVILESAYFDPATIAHTSRRHVLRTEASVRFERGMDPEMAPRAAARAAQLIAELARGKVSEQEVDEYPRPIERARVTLRPQRTERLLGSRIAPETQARLLASLGFGVSETDGAIQVEVPTFRPDLAGEEDLVEEVARLAGFEQLPSTLPPGKAGGLDPQQRFERSLRTTLVALGVQEAWTPSFMNEHDCDVFAEQGAAQRVELANPMSEDERALRTTMIPGLLRSVARNLAHRASGAALFELGRVYEFRERADEDADAPRLPTEPAILAAAFSGLRAQAAWQQPARPWDFYSVKGILEALFAAHGLPAPGFAAATGSPFHPTRAATVSLNGTPIGALGELHPDVCARYDVAEGTLVWEIAVAGLVAALPERVKAEELPRFPPTYLDLAVVVREDVPAARVAEVVDGAGRPELRSARLFDLYRGEQVPHGSKSLAFALELRGDDKTLTDAEAIAVRDRIVTALAERFAARLRA